MQLCGGDGKTTETMTVEKHTTTVTAVEQQGDGEAIILVDTDDGGVEEIPIKKDEHGFWMVDNDTLVRGDIYAAARQRVKEMNVPLAAEVIGEQFAFAGGDGDD